MLSCRQGGDSLLLRTRRGRLTAAAPLVVADLVVYGTGVEREAALTRAALTAMRRTGDPNERAVLAAGAEPGRTSLDGARAAGVPLARYRQVVAAVDSLLVERETRERAGREVGAAPLSAQTESNSIWAVPRLDSLRVELVVLRSRLAAELARPCRPGRSMPAPTPC